MVRLGFHGSYGKSGELWEFMGRVGNHGPRQGGFGRLTAKMAEMAGVAGPISTN
jgi:hypothetical protein